MSNLEDEVKDLREKNNELVQTVQYWKMTAAQRENEKLDLMKEINELRLKLSRIRSGGAAQVRQLDVSLQAASQEALTHLVQASSAVARAMELAKAYMRDRQELDASSPRWSTISGTPTTDRVNRVPPLLIGGQSIQPVVSLSRTLLSSNGTQSSNRSPNQQNRSVTSRAVAMNMLQDVYIPLTRVDAGEQLNSHNVDSDVESNNIEDSTEDLELEDSGERVIEESQNVVSDIDDYETSRRLDAVIEEEPEDEDQTPPVQRMRVENPLEGPSWLLDIQTTQSRRKKSRVALEADSTTELEEGAASGPAEAEGAGLGCEYSPTVRRRKRTSSPRAPRTPHYSPRRNSINGRVLKVLVAKMRLDESAEGANDVSPPKRAMRERSPLQTPKNKQRSESPVIGNGPLSKRLARDAAPSGRNENESSSKQEIKSLMRFDAPSPNGATDARVIVSKLDSRVISNPSESKSDARASGEPSDTLQRTARCGSPEPCCSAAGSRRNKRDTRDTHRDTRDTGSDTHRDTRDTGRDTRDTLESREARDSDSDSSADRAEGRSRRPRKAVTYKEKPLNRKLRR